MNSIGQHRGLADVIFGVARQPKDTAVCEPEQEARFPVPCKWTGAGWPPWTKDVPQQEAPPFLPLTCCSPAGYSSVLCLFCADDLQEDGACLRLNTADSAPEVTEENPMFRFGFPNAVPSFSFSFFFSILWKLLF